MRYTDHAYQNRSSKGTDERPSPVSGWLSDRVDELSDLIHRTRFKGDGWGDLEHPENTGDMSGYPKNIRGDVITTFDVPLSELPQEAQDKIAEMKRTLGVFNDAGELVKPETWEGTTEQIDQLYDDFGNFYDNDPEYANEIITKVDDTIENDPKFQENDRKLEEINSKLNHTITKYTDSTADYDPNPAATAAMADYNKMVEKNKATRDKMKRDLDKKYPNPFETRTKSDGSVVMDYKPGYSKGLQDIHNMHIEKHSVEHREFLKKYGTPAQEGKAGYGKHKSAMEIRSDLEAERDELIGQWSQEFDKLLYKFLVPKTGDWQGSNVSGDYAAQAYGSELGDIWQTGMDIAGKGGSPYQPWDDPAKDKGPFVPPPNKKIAGGLPYTKDDDPFGADDRGDDWEDDSDILPGDFPFPTATKGGDTKVASAKRDKDYSLGAYVGGTTSKTSKKKKKKNNTMVASYKPQGKLISEGWASPKHTDVNKDEKKRWFSEKDIKPEYPKEKPPKMVNGYHPKLLPQLDTPIPYIKVKKKDLLRAHKLTKNEAQKWTSLIDKLNAYIMRNPNMLAYARERYPKSDPHLAALNYKMDMQIAASDEYIETRFPENKRLYGKLMQATKRSIDLTDPKTFKSRKGKMTSINKLMRVDYVMSEYDPTDKEVKNKRIKSNKKSIGRFFRKPKKKTKSDILKDKMAVLDNEMKKTMPEA